MLPVLKILKTISSYIGKGGVRADLFDCFLSSLLKMAKPRRKVAMDNLSIAFPQSDAEWRKKILIKAYNHLSSALVEYIVALNDPEVVVSWFEKTEGKEYLDEALANGKGAILLFGHFGNWELLGGWLALSNYPVYAMVRKHDDKDLEELIDSYRRRMGLKVIDKDNIREPVRQLKKGHFVAIAGDQHWGEGGIKAPFFGKLCSTPPGPAMYAFLTGAPIIPIAAYRDGKYTYTFEAQPPIRPQRQADKQKEISRLTIKANQAIEEMVKKAPEQWLWMHRRWR